MSVEMESSEEQKNEDPDINDKSSSLSSNRGISYFRVLRDAKSANRPIER